MHKDKKYIKLLYATATILLFIGAVLFSTLGFVAQVEGIIKISYFSIGVILSLGSVIVGLICYYSPRKRTSEPKEAREEMPIEL